jgi:hypothetical protein
MGVVSPKLNCLKSMCRVVSVALLASIFFSPILPQISFANSNTKDLGQEKWAIIIGISTYAYVNNLRYCDDDASELSSLLTPNWGTNHIKLLTNSNAKKASIQDAINGWLSPLEDADDTVLFFFSGHGSNGPDVAPMDEADGIDEYICPYDSTLSNYSSYIRDDELDQWLSVLNAGKIVVVLDTCFAGGFLNSMTRINGESGEETRFLASADEPNEAIVNDDFSKDISKPGRVVLTACAENEDSNEDADIQNGAFSYFTIDGLRNQGKIADTNSNHEISAQEIFNYAAPLTLSFSQNSSHLTVQHPQMYDGYGSQISLLTMTAFTVDSNPRGVTTIVDGNEYSRLQLPTSFLWPTNTTHSITVATEAYANNISSEAVTAESPHPYSNNYNNTRTFAHSGASKMRVHFSYIDTESYYDYVYFGSATTFYSSKSGYYYDSWSSWVPGDTIRVKITSDSSNTYNGFKIDRLEWMQEAPAVKLKFASWNDTSTSSTRSLVIAADTTLVASFQVQRSTSVYRLQDLAIASLTSNSACFLYADPLRMTLAVATYDVAAGGIIYGACQSPQNQDFDTDSFLVSQVLSDRGRLVCSNKTVLLFGGPNPSWSVSYLEGQRLTPVRFQVDSSQGSTHLKFVENQTGLTKVDRLVSSIDFAHEDYFVVMSLVDRNDNCVFISYGFDWKGTWGAGIYLKAMSSSITGFANAYYIFHWVDSNADGIPQSNEMVQVATGN